jgi:hypothetical protein
LAARSAAHVIAKIDHGFAAGLERWRRLVRSPSDRPRPSAAIGGATDFSAFVLLIGGR